MAPSRPLSRRRFLEIASVASGAMAFHSGPWGLTAQAAEPGTQLLLFVYFSGGWDQLLLFDPRPNDVAAYQRAQAYSASGTGIFPAYDLVLDPAVRTLLSTNPSGVQVRGNLSFGPAIPTSLLDHAADLCLARGVTMDTLAHEVGRRYFLTGKFPRGVAANGSSLGTVVAAGAQSTLDIPNLSIATEAYNEGLAASASPIQARSAADVRNVLRPFGTPLSAGVASALADHQAQADSCAAHELDGEGLVAMFRSSRLQARSIVTSQADALFNFSLTAPPPEVQPLFDAFGIVSNTDLAGPKGRAAMAAQALAKDISQAVSVELVTGLDDHFDWDQTHANELRAGFDALGRLITYLKAQSFRGGPDTVWQHTTLVVCSEFSRTPLLNGRDGRDHHLASSALLAGPGIRGDLVIGGTDEKGMGARKVRLTTGAPDDVAGVPLRPADLHATVLQSMGLSTAHLSNQSPRIVTAMLK